MDDYWSSKIDSDSIENYTWRENEEKENERNYSYPESKR